MLMLTSLSSFAGAETEKINVFVSIPPQAYFVERVGGESVDVEVLVNPGNSPATYEPTPKQVARLGRAAVFFRIGVPFEKGFMDKLADTHKNLSIVDIRKGVTLRQFREVELRNYKKAQGRQVPPDPHIWLDPEQAKIQAATICEALSRLAPESAPVFEENLQAFQADLDRIHQRMVTALSPYKGETFYVYHPAFGYIADACGLIQVAVEIEGKEPTPKQLADLIELAKTDGAKVIFVQPQFAKKSAEAVANAIGGSVTPLDPLARNYFENLEKMTETLKAAFEER
jgi:zinc transport system substrate-binding protein